MKSNEVISFVDQNGKKIEAHGGGLLFFEGMYYWYGEDRRENCYVRAYRSKDLVHWEDCGAMITTRTPIVPFKKGIEKHQLLNEDGTKVNLERPKVIYNEETKQFVMWMHFENGKDYLDAMAAIATSAYPDHGFTYRGAFRPLGHMSRDCTLFKEENGTAYFISASNENQDLHIYRLSSDYLSVDYFVQKLFVGLYREAPALMKIEGTYYLLSSYCTGWLPNQCQYATATAIEGKWSELHNIGNHNTYHSQPTFLFEVNGVPYYLGDCWGGVNWEKIEEFDYTKSSYLCMGFVFEDGKLFFDKDKENN